MRVFNHKLVNNKRGNVAIIFALCLPVLVFLIGMGVDYTYASYINTTLKAALDAAVLSSVSQSTINSAGSTSNTTYIQTHGMNVFAADISKLNISVTPTIAAAVNPVIGSLVVSGSYSYAVPTFFSGILGVNSISVSGSAKSERDVPPYINFYMLLDNTPSMGVGATAADITNLQNLTVNQPDGTCAFACHETDVTSPSLDNYTIARNNGVTLQIDSVRLATQALTQTAAADEVLPNQYQMAIYDFGTDASTLSAQTPQPYQISPMSSNMATVSANAALVNIMSVPSQNYNQDEQTNFNSVMSAMTSLIPLPGTGATPATPQEVLFFVTDGVNDGYDCTKSGKNYVYNSGSSCRRITPIDPTWCSTLKSEGVTIAVLYTTYLPLPSNSFYNSYLASYINAPSQVASNLQSCATPGYYFEVSPTVGISAAMNALFQKVIANARLTG